MFDDGLSIIIPFYNETSRLDINKNMASILSYLKDCDNFELILINDCSQDNTLEVLKEFNSLPFCKVFTNVKNYGKGYSIRKGILEASYNNILYMDADLSVPIDNIKKFYTLLDDKTCVIASRYLHGSKIVNKRSFIRNFMSWFSRVILLKICGLKISDSQCGFKMFKKDSSLYLENFKTTRWLFDLELLRHLKYKKYKIIEIPIVWNNCEESTLKSKDAIISSLKELIAILTKKEV